MPAYDFKCPACSHIVEVTRPSSDDSEVACPKCGAAMRRVFGPVGVHFKGSGFHNTDYRKSAPAAEAPTCPATGSAPACGST